MNYWAEVPLELLHLVAQFTASGLVAMRMALSCKSWHAGLLPDAAVWESIFHRQGHFVAALPRRLTPAGEPKVDYQLASCYSHIAKFNISTSRCAVRVITQVPLSHEDSKAAYYCSVQASSFGSRLYVTLMTHSNAGSFEYSRHHRSLILSVDPTNEDEYINLLSKGVLLNEDLICLDMAQDQLEDLGEPQFARLPNQLEHKALEGDLDLVTWALESVNKILDPDGSRDSDQICKALVDRSAGNSSKFVIVNEDGYGFSKDQGVHLVNVDTGQIEVSIDPGAWTPQFYTDNKVVCISEHGGLAYYSFSNLTTGTKPKLEVIELPGTSQSKSRRLTAVGCWKDSLAVSKDLDLIVLRLDKSNRFETFTSPLPMEDTVALTDAFVALVHRSTKGHSLALLQRPESGTGPLIQLAAFRFDLTTSDDHVLQFVDNTKLFVQVDKQLMLVDWTKRDMLKKVTALRVGPEETLELVGPVCVSQIFPWLAEELYIDTSLDEAVLSFIVPESQTSRFVVFYPTTGLYVRSLPHPYLCEARLEWEKFGQKQRKQGVPFWTLRTHQRKRLTPKDGHLPVPDKDRSIEEFVVLYQVQDKLGEWWMEDFPATADFAKVAALAKDQFKLQRAEIQAPI